MSARVAPLHGTYKMSAWVPPLHGTYKMSARVPPLHGTYKMPNTHHIKSLQHKQFLHLVCLYYNILLFYNILTLTLS